MNRAGFIIGMIVVSTLLAPSMFCVMPGATLTPAEAECCRQMTSNCGDVQMGHSCCKPSKASGELSLNALAKPQPSLIGTTVIDILVWLRPELQRSRDGNGFSKFALQLPSSNHSLDILRI